MNFPLGLIECNFHFFFFHLFYNPEVAGLSPKRISRVESDCLQVSLVSVECYRYIKSSQCLLFQRICFYVIISIFEVEPL